MSYDVFLSRFNHTSTDSPVVGVTSPLHLLRVLQVKNTTARSAKLRRIEIAVAIGLWAFIFLVAVAFLLAAQFRG